MFKSQSSTKVCPDAFTLRGDKCLWNMERDPFTVFNHEYRVFLDHSGQKTIFAHIDSPKIGWDLVGDTKDGERWNGVIRTVMGCSSSLIQTWPDGLRPGQKASAYILTAGHCIGGNQDVYLDATPPPAFGFEPFSVNSTQPQVFLNPKTIRFSAFFGFGSSRDPGVPDRDIAIIELENKALDLLHRGVKFYKISSKEMSGSGIPLEMVGFPKVGSSTGTLLRKRHSQGTSLRRESPSSTHWITNMNSFGGFSGSPTFRKDTGMIVGVMSGLLDAPHEAKIDRADDVAGCFPNNKGGVWDYSSPGCLHLWKKQDLSVNLCVYKETYLKGDRECYKEPVVNSPLKGVVSSIHTKKGCAVTVFQGPNKTGKSIVLSQEYTRTLDPEFDQRIGSLSISCKP